MLIHLTILVICAALMVAAVRRLIIGGIENICTALNWSVKTKGQLIGYVTSLPELVVVVVSAVNGVFEAGIWNVATSNIINWLLFGSAVVVYRQHGDLFNWLFVDELLFGVLSVILPLMIVFLDIQMNVMLAGGLLGLFFVYKIVDRMINPNAVGAQIVPTAVAGHLTKGLVAMAIGLAIVIAAGHYLGIHSRLLIQSVGVPAWLIGWILGTITSIPELTAFLEIYRLSKRRRQLHQIQDTQAALDALVASNMSNLGVILPLGMIGLWVFP